MKQTLFLGIATVLDAIGAFLATRQHFHSAYSLFAVAILMVVVAVWVSYWKEYRIKRGRRELGQMLVELSLCELASYDGNDGGDYDKLIGRIKKVKERVETAAQHLDDASVVSRFLAVNVLDVQLDEATKRHFMDRAQGSFWTMYQQIKGWRACVEQLLKELPRT
jgi:hypothetical protein